VGNSVKFSLEKQYKIRTFSEKKISFSGEQIRDNKCSTKSGKTLHIALCFVVKYIHEK